MNNEEIIEKQNSYRSLITDLDKISEKMIEFEGILSQIQDEFTLGSAVNSDLFERFMMVAQEYYTIDTGLKDRLPDVGNRDGYNVDEQKNALSGKLALLDEELIKNSVSHYFDLAAADEEKTDELESTKNALRGLLDAPEGLNIAAIRPYSSILQLVDNPDAELADELMDEIDDTFPKSFVRAVLRGKVYAEGGAPRPQVASAAAPAHNPNAMGYSQTLD